MANFKVYVTKSPRNGNYTVRYRDGKTKLANGQWKMFSEATIDKTQTLMVGGKLRKAEWIAEDLAEKIRERYYTNKLEIVDSDEKLEPLIEKFILFCEE